MNSFRINGSLTTQHDFRIGDVFTVTAPAPQGLNMVALESNGDTGFFYALDNARSQPFQDGLQIWTQGSADDKPYTAKIYWSDDGLKAVLTVNDYPNAIFDFERKVGTCRTGEPHRLGQTWSPDGHDWQEPMLEEMLAPVITQWSPLLKRITEILGETDQFENYEAYLLVVASPNDFLGSTENISAIQEAVSQLSPAGYDYRFFEIQASIVLLISANKYVRETLARERGFEIQD